VTLQIVRDWVLRFNAHGPDGLLDRKAPGPASLMQDTHRTCQNPSIEADIRRKARRMAYAGSNHTAVVNHLTTDARIG
jgi:hypothetical protein